MKESYHQLNTVVADTDACRKLQQKAQAEMMHNVASLHLNHTAAFAMDVIKTCQSTSHQQSLGSEEKCARKGHYGRKVWCELEVSVRQEPQ